MCDSQRTEDTLSPSSCVHAQLYKNGTRSTWAPVRAARTSGLAAPLAASSELLSLGMGLHGLGVGRKASWWLYTETITRGNPMVGLIV